MSQPFYRSVFHFAMGVMVTTVLFSCAKKATGVRGQHKKSQSQNINSTVSAQAEALAASQNILYKIATLNTPNLTELGATVGFELQTPDNQYLPITTHHENGDLNSEGIYQDTERAVEVYVQARCSSDACMKYLLLVTVVKNNQAVFQSAAVSYKHDCQFYAVSVTNSFHSLDALETYVQSNSSYATPRNDCPINE